MVSKLRGSTGIVSQPKFSLPISVISRELQFALAVLLYVSAVNNDDDDDDIYRYYYCSERCEPGKSATKTTSVSLVDV